MSRFYLSAAHKSSGKTTLAIGLCAALTDDGFSVQPFKKGPDYIDPLWLTRAATRQCHNLDFHTASEAFNHALFQQYATTSEIALVEGNMGLFDGLSLDGSDSNAAMAKLLDLPVILVLDCAGTSGGVAPLLTGYQVFDPNVHYAGVILNKLAGQRHESKIRALVEHYTDFRVFGAMHRTPSVHMTERHLGLIPSNEISADADRIIGQLAEQVRQSVDLALLEPDSAQSPAPPASSAALRRAPQNPDTTLRVAIIRDDAFGFYYPGDLERFAQLGVELVELNACEDSELPPAVQGLFIGGGFPESRLAELSANQSLRDSIRSAILQGLPTYAECGGLMYLCETMQLDAMDYPLCNVIPARVNMNPRPQGRGYVKLKVNANHPWYAAQANLPDRVNAHEFHYSSLEILDSNLEYAYTLDRGAGIDGTNDGIILHNLVANYSHLRQTDRCLWVDDFVAFIQRYESRKPA